MSKFFLSILFLLALSFSAQGFDVPAMTGPVQDQVGLLSTSAKNEISQRLHQVYANQGPQIQVLILSSLQDQPIEQAAIQIFDQWKLGDRKKDNGILFLIAPNEKKIRIEVGRGLEGDIPDVIAKRIISDTVRPYFKQGDFQTGIIQGVTALLQYSRVATEPLNVEGEPPPHSESKGSGWIYLIVFLIWLALFIFNPSLALALIFSGGRGGRGGWGGGSGGGGWSGGGGGSAGGGASGDW